ncbi:MAG: carbon-nitrogen hydrolase family protein [Planctomyces sp.]|nr:carbon-nitrogen hydrolase family protein [Planctomyces sp.]
MRIAAVQMDVRLNDVPHNVGRISEFLRQTARAGAKLAIFPECATTGYCFTSLEEGRAVAEPIPGPTTEALAAVCRETGSWCVFGMLEASGTDVFNVAVLVGPQGVTGAYRKVHLPWLGIDMFTTPGDRPFAVQDVDGLRLGMNICYDSGFPEASRCLALGGADLIALPTNWPPGAECMAAHAVPTRAMENAVYFAAVNRVGAERGFKFIGHSSICAPNGDVLAAASASEEEILYADVDPARARNKRIVRVPSKHVIDRMADRRPEMYQAVVESHALSRPRDDAGRPG